MGPSWGHLGNCQCTLQVASEIRLMSPHTLDLLRCHAKPLDSSSSRRNPRSSSSSSSYGEDPLIYQRSWSLFLNKPFSHQKGGGVGGGRWIPDGGGSGGAVVRGRGKVPEPSWGNLGHPGPTCSILPPSWGQLAGQREPKTYIIVVSLFFQGPKPLKNQRFFQ